MKRSIICVLMMILLFIPLVSTVAEAAQVPPDKVQQVLDLMTIACQNIYDYSYAANAGDFSRYDSVRGQFGVNIGNVSLLLNGFAQNSVNRLWNVYNAFASDGASARSAADNCSQIRGEIYSLIQQSTAAATPVPQISSFDDCARAGYRVSGGVCFMGGSPVYDNWGNLIGFYYTDCFDANGFHQGTCWDCFYGADYNGCIAKP